VGMFGTLLGTLDSFRGGSYTRWTFIMYLAGSFSIALLFTALGLLISVLSMWSYDCLALRSNKLEREMQDATLATMTQLGVHPEACGKEMCEVSLDWDDRTRSRRWEVSYDRHSSVLLSVWAFVLYL